MNMNAPKIGREEGFFLSLNSACTIVQKFAEESLRDAGLSIAEYTFMRIIENTPGITAGEARGRLYATAPSVAQLVAQLERRGFIKRGKDSMDARRLPLRLTPKGANVLRKARKHVDSVVQKMRLPAGLLDSLTSNLSSLLSSLPPYGTR